MFDFKYFYKKNKMTITFEQLKSKIRKILASRERTVNEKLQMICQLLQTEVSYYNWVGFYFRNGQKEELILGPYAGTPTNHTVIPFGKGICGQVALSNQNFIVPDVGAQNNYIACSLTVKSEIVVPLFFKGQNIGQIDIDSETLDPFTPADERFLEFVCEQISKNIINLDPLCTGH